MRLSLIFLAGILLLTACSGPKDTPLPKSRAELDTIKSAIATLTPEEKDWLYGYFYRKTAQESRKTSEASGIPDGITISEAIKAQKKYKADLAIAESMQIKACSEDVKLGLNDPNSLEVVSSRPFTVSDGTHRIDLTFTAKNAFGGRVRSSAVCGFLTEMDTTLNPEDLMNKMRALGRSLHELGIKPERY